MLPAVKKVRQRLIFGIGLGVGLFATLLVANSASPLVYARGDCSSNAIIYCGFSSASEFIAQTRANDSKNGYHDLQAVYAHYGLEPADYDRFVRTARPATAYRDGRLVVDGQVVARDTNSIGRNASSQGRGYFTLNIGGKNYYGNSNGQAFASDSLPAMAMFDAQGALEFAVLTACGNPIGNTPIRPSYSCDMLQSSAVSGQPGTYEFSTAASAGNNAAIAKVVYDFGDGKTETQTNPQTKVRHTYAKSGKYTAKVTVYVNLPGNQQTTVSSGSCEKVIEVTLPFYECLQLTGAILEASKYSYRFVAQARSGGGATLATADFDMGDGKKLTGVKPAASASNEVAVEYAYKNPGKYSVTATLHFTLDGRDVTAPACRAGVTPTTPPTPECKPGIPVGDSRCTPCQYDASLPSDSPQCVAPPPPELPSTGAGNVAAIVGVMAVVGFVIYRQMLYRKHKAAFHAAEMGTSPLPLGQPLDDNAPLAGTPLEPKHRRRTFRRRRTF